MDVRFIAGTSLFIDRRQSLNMKSSCHMVTILLIYGFTCNTVSAIAYVPNQHRRVPSQYLAPSWQQRQQAQTQVPQYQAPQKYTHPSTYGTQQQQQRYRPQTSSQQTYQYRARPEQYQPGYQQGYPERNLKPSHTSYQQPNRQPQKQTVHQYQQNPYRQNSRQYQQNNQQYQQNSQSYQQNRQNTQPMYQTTQYRQYYNQAGNTYRPSTYQRTAQTGNPPQPQYRPRDVVTTTTTTTTTTKPTTLEVGEGPVPPGEPTTTPASVATDPVGGFLYWATPPPKSNEGPEAAEAGNGNGNYQNGNTENAAENGNGNGNGQTYQWPSSAPVPSPPMYLNPYWQTLAMYQIYSKALFTKRS